MIGYANYVDQQWKEETDREPEPAVVNFERGLGDLPLLPMEVKGVRGIEITKNAREIIRAYFLRHYHKIAKHFIKWLNNYFSAELATGCESARTPWSLIGEDPSKFFDISCIPPGFKFQDPSRMGINVKALLSHLCE